MFKFIDDNKNLIIIMDYGCTLRLSQLLYILLNSNVHNKKQQTKTCRNNKKHNQTKPKISHQLL